jgi:hypothetical protein
MAENQEITFEYLPIGKSGRIQILITLPGTKFTDKFDVTDETKRKEFADKLVEKFPGLPREEVDRQLERIAGEMVARSLEKAESPEEEGVTEILAQIVIDSEDAELFHHGVRHDAEAFVTITVETHRETWPVRSAGFSHWLRQQYYVLCSQAPSAQAMTDAINLIGSVAIFSGEQQQVFMRVADHDGAIYVDLGDAEHRVIKVTSVGWSEVSGDTVPVRFIRRRGMEPLPLPVKGGSIEELWPCVNVRDRRARILLAAILVSYLWPRGPYIIFVVNGEQGSAKSTLCRIVRALIDPIKAGLRRPPRDDRDLMIAANNGWIVCLDNLSGVAPNLSDAICSLATGGGFGTRELYSDDEEKLFDAMRPVMLNGIPELATRPDLLDRAIVFVLPTIPEDERQDEAALRSAFESARPRILGAILDGISMALRRRNEVKFDHLPRMADFALIAAAAMPAFGWTGLEFLDAYLGNRAEAHEAAIDASAVGPAILALMTEMKTWEGTASELLAELERRAGEKAVDRKDWPKSGRGLRDLIARLAPNLRASGVNVIFGRRKPGGKRDRLIVLERCEPKPPAPDGDPQGGRDDPPPSRDAGQGDDRPEENGPGEGAKAERDDGDGRDDQKPTVQQAPIPSALSSATSTCSSDGIQPSQSSRPSQEGLTGSGRPISAGRSGDDQGDAFADDRPETKSIFDLVVEQFGGQVVDGNPIPLPPRPKPPVSTRELFRDAESVSWGPDNA